MRHLLQAAPLRRIVVEHGLNLHEEGKYASGGFMANMQVLLTQSPTYTMAAI